MSSLTGPRVGLRVPFLRLSSLREVMRGRSRIFTRNKNSRKHVMRSLTRGPVGEDMLKLMKRRGFTMRMMNWRALSISPYRMPPVPPLSAPPPPSTYNSPPPPPAATCLSLSSLSFSSKRQRLTLVHFPA